MVGIHLRRGDYGPPPFYSTPSSWYKDYLDGLWQTLDNPVLFIASDEPLKVVKDFSEYGPITSNDLGIKLPEAEFYPDFYILSQCDVLLISNSSFSFAASMLNHHSRTFVRPHFKAGKLVPFDPWDSQPFMYFDVGPLGIYNILRWIKSGMKNSIVRIIQGVLLKVIGKENLERALEKDSGKQCT